MGAKPHTRLVFVDCHLIKVFQYAEFSVARGHPVEHHVPDRLRDVGGIRI